MHRDQVATTGDPVGKHRDLSRIEWHITENNDVMTGKCPRSHVGDISNIKFIQTFRTQNLRIVACKNRFPEFEMMRTGPPGA